MDQPGLASTARFVALVSASACSKASKVWIVSTAMGSSPSSARASLHGIVRPEERERPHGQRPGSSRASVGRVSVHGPATIVRFVAAAQLADDSTRAPAHSQLLTELLQRFALPFAGNQPISILVQVSRRMMAFLRSLFVTMRAAPQAASSSPS